MAAKKASYKDILSMAQRYGVADNALFISAAARYTALVDEIATMQARVKADGPMVPKQIMSGDSNMVAHPLINLISKHSDTANKTLGQMLDIVVRLGHKDEPDAGAAFNCD